MPTLLGGKTVCCEASSRHLALDSCTVQTGAAIDRDDERRRADQHCVFTADDDFARRAGDDFHGPVLYVAEGKTRAGPPRPTTRHFFDAVQHVVSAARYPGSMGACFEKGFDLRSGVDREEHALAVRRAVVERMPCIRRWRPSNTEAPGRAESITACIARQFASAIWREMRKIARSNGGARRRRSPSPHFRPNGRSKGMILRAASSRRSTRRPWVPPSRSR